MKLGLLGNPLAHSWSVQIHEYVLQEPCYQLYEVNREMVREFFETNDLDGFNVTIPYKQTVMDYMDEIDPAALRIGAVNTVVHKDGTFYGYNTDCLGFMQMLEQNNIPVKGNHAAILGSGGASKAAMEGIRMLGGTFDVVSRNPEDGMISYEELYENEKRYSLIVNATPVGMYPHTEAVPVDLSHFSDLLAVVDIVANPLRTSLMMRAKEMGIPALGGLEMLVRQAVEADRLYTGNEYPESLVKSCMNELLKKNRNIVLIGMPTSGKSTVAKLLAERMNKTVIDTDEAFETDVLRKMYRCHSIRSFIEQYGEDRFREKESEVISALHHTGVIISTGGGVIKREVNMRSLAHNGIIFWLDRSVEYLYGTPDRPLSTNYEAICRLYEERKDLYAKYCDVRIENNGTPEEAAEKIIQTIEEGIVL